MRISDWSSDVCASDLDGRFRFKPDWAAIGPDHAGMPQLPDHLAVTDESSPEHPWRLVTAPARQFLNTTFTETDTSRQREGRPTARIHPEDCRELGLAEGDRVRLGNRKGSVVVHVLRSEEHTSELQSLM